MNAIVSASGVDQLHPSEAAYQALSNHMIELADGSDFDILNPKFDIWNVAHSLGMTTRFAGHIRRFYSVADHSVMVSQLMEYRGGDPMEGLLHDGVESVMGDIVSPHKQFFPDWKKVDKRLETAFRAQFNMPAEKSRECMWADWIALFIEAYYLLPSRGDPKNNPIWTDPYDMRAQALDLLGDFPFIISGPDGEGRDRFLARYEELGGVR